MTCTRVVIISISGMSDGPKLPLVDSSSTLINQAIFRSREINDLFPPNDGWKVIGTKRGGLTPVPTFRAVEVKQVRVEGCGLSKLSGKMVRVVIPLNM